MTLKTTLKTYPPSVPGVTADRHQGRLWLALLVWLALPELVQAQFIFTTNSGAITITGYSGGPDVAVPATINGYPVTSIGDNAFDNDFGVTNAIIPDGVTNLGNLAFAFCTSLTSMDIPDGLTNIGRQALDACTSLTNINVLTRPIAVWVEFCSTCHSDHA
jgi:hypothetical protein